MLSSGVDCAQAESGFTDHPLKEELGIYPCFLIHIFFQKKNASGTLRCSGRVTKLYTLEAKQGHSNTFLQNVFPDA